MNNALIISSIENSASHIAIMLKKASFDNVLIAKNAGEARRIMIQKDFDICVINSPLIDESGEELAKTIASKQLSSILLLVKSEFFEEISLKTEDYGIITLSKPLNKSLFWNALKMLIATNKRMQLMKKENEKLLTKLKEFRIIDRAKCLLISYLSMSESEAHRYIEKQAMDTRHTKGEVAENILKTYEN